MPDIQELDLFVSTTSASKFDSLATFKEYVESVVSSNQGYHEFILTDVPPSWGDAVLI